MYLYKEKIFQQNDRLFDLNVVDVIKFKILIN